MTHKEAVEVLDYYRELALPEHHEALALAIRELDREWTSELPKEKVPYWWRLNENSEAEILVPAFTSKDTGELFVKFHGEFKYVSAIGGEWCGPLTPPE